MKRRANFVHTNSSHLNSVAFNEAGVCVTVEMPGRHPPYLRFMNKFRNEYLRKTDLTLKMNSNDGVASKTDTIDHDFADVDLH